MRSSVGGMAMELHPLVSHEWRDDHRLSKRSLLWIHEHADPDDPMPIVSAIAQLRAEALANIEIRSTLRE